MTKQKILKSFLDGVEKLFSLLTKPFSEAADLEAYSRRGFYLLGFLIVTTTVGLWWQGILATPLSQSNVIVRSIYTALIQRTIILSNLPDSYVTLAFLPFVAYLVIGLWPNGRRVVGEFTANSVFRLLNGLIGLGEWCIEHRWFSFFLIIFITAGIAALTTIQVGRLITERKLRNEFENWLEDADEFIAFNPLTKPEASAYKRVQNAWRADFNRILRKSDGSIHPAVCLDEILEKLYSEESEQPWIDTLQLKVEDISKTLSKCSTTPGPRLDAGEVRTLALTSLLMARINVRIAEDVNAQSYSNYRELVRALEFFKTVANLPFDSQEYGRRYRADAFNGQGTVYGNALTAYLKSSTTLTPEQTENLKTVCSIPSQCAIRALTAFEDAGKDWPRCSYQGKRELSNTTELLTIIGRHYEETAKNLTAKPLNDWTRTRPLLAEQIAQHIRNLMNCNAGGPFLSSFPLTVASGFGVSAELKLASNQDATADVLSAARYLRLANSFEPQNVTKWEYSYFCSAVKTDPIKSTFRDALMSDSDGLPNSQRVLDLIEKKCQ